MTKPRYTPATGGPKQTAWIYENIPHAAEAIDRSEAAQRDSDECFARFGLQRGRDIAKQIEERKSA